VSGFLRLRYVEMEEIFPAWRACGAFGFLR
jgi:hypothetical protein